MTKHKSWTGADAYDSVEEAFEAVENDMSVQSLSEFEKFRKQNPTLNEAWEQIKLIRSLTEKHNPADNRPKWMKMYMDVANGVDTNNKALKEAWDRYYMIKNLILGSKKMY